MEAAAMLAPGRDVPAGAGSLARILAGSGSSADRPALVGAGGAPVPWGILPALVQAAGTALGDLASRRVGMLLRPSATCLTALAALERHGCDVFLLDAELAPEAAQALGR